MVRGAAGRTRSEPRSVATALLLVSAAHSHIDAPTGQDGRSCAGLIQPLGAARGQVPQCRPYARVVRRHGHTPASGWGRVVACWWRLRSQTLSVASSLADQSCAPPRAVRGGRPSGTLCGTGSAAPPTLGAQMRGCMCMHPLPTPPTHARSHARTQCACGTFASHTRTPDVTGRSRAQAPSSCAPAAPRAAAHSPRYSAGSNRRRCQRLPALRAMRTGSAPAGMAAPCVSPRRLGRAPAWWRTGPACPAMSCMKLNVLTSHTHTVKSFEQLSTCRSRRVSAPSSDLQPAGRARQTAPRHLLTVRVH